MKLLIETCLDDLYLALIKNGKTLVYIREENLLKKSDELPIAFKKLIDDQGIKVKDITDIYVTKGPGSFMGVRAGLIFASTIAQVTGAKLHTCDTLFFASKGAREFWVDAKGRESYYFDPKAYQTKLVEGYHESFVDYEDIFNHPESYLVLFEETKAAEVQANYMKEPSVG